MAEPYLTRLAQIIDQLEPLQVGGAKLESRHFFSGAALYANGMIIASLSPAGLAVKLPEDRRKSLIAEGIGEEFRFFTKGPIKKEYVALSNATIADAQSMRELIEVSVAYTLGKSNP